MFTSVTGSAPPDVVSACENKDVESSDFLIDRVVCAAFISYLTFLDRIDLDSANIQTGVNFLETIGIIGAGRALVILG